MITPFILQHLQLILVISLVSPLPFMSLLLLVSSLHLADLVPIKARLLPLFVGPLLFGPPLRHIAQLVLIVRLLPPIFLVLRFCFVFVVKLADAVRSCSIILTLLVVVPAGFLLVVQVLDAAVHVVLFSLLGEVFEVLFVLLFHLLKPLVEIIGLFVFIDIVGGHVPCPLKLEPIIYAAVPPLLPLKLALHLHLLQLPYLPVHLLDFPSGLLGYFPVG